MLDWDWWLGLPRAMLNWWVGLPWRLRLGVALLYLFASTILCFVGLFWPEGWAIGIVLLILSFPSSFERKDYHDL
jgi:hypothetical protein